MSATMTSEGYVPHLKVVTGDGVILAPVKLRTVRVAKGVRVYLDYSKESDRRHPEPMRRNGRLVFALPGGGEVLG